MAGMIRESGKEIRESGNRCPAWPGPGAASTAAADCQLTRAILATRASGVRLWSQRDRAWRRRQFSRRSAEPGGAIEPVGAAFRRSAVSQSRQAAVAPLTSEWIDYAALAI